MDTNKAQAVKIIREHRIGRGTERRPELTMRKAAARTPKVNGRPLISESWWQQVEMGGTRAGDHFVEANPSWDTLITMARVVGAEHEVAALQGDHGPSEREHALAVKVAAYGRGELSTREASALARQLTALSNPAFRRVLDAAAEERARGESATG